MLLLPGACIVQTTVPSANSTPLALTPGTQATLDPEAIELIQAMPTHLVEDAGDAPILITPDALPLESALRTPTIVSTPNPETSTCGRSDAITLLILGIDYNAQADAIRLVRIDFSKPEFNLVAIPRDFYISVVGFDRYDIDKGRINATFGYGEYFLGTGKGAKALAENRVPPKLQGRSLVGVDIATMMIDSKTQAEYEEHLKEAKKDAYIPIVRSYFYRGDVADFHPFRG